MQKLLSDFIGVTDTYLPYFPDYKAHIIIGRIHNIYNYFVKK